MWCDRVVRNLSDFNALAIPSPSVDLIDIDWSQCGRVLKARSRAGIDVRVLLPPGARLKHGDVISEEDRVMLVINVRPCEIIVAASDSVMEMNLLALELGNLHWPTEIGKGEILFPEDGPPMEVLANLHISWTRQTRRFAPAAVIGGPAVKVAGQLQIIRRGETRNNS